MVAALAILTAGAGATYWLIGSPRPEPNNRRSGLASDEKRADASSALDDPDAEVDEAAKDMNAQFGLDSTRAPVDGVLEESTESVNWYERAAENADADAQHMVGESYFISGNVPKAIKWFRRAAEQGHVTAQSKLGSIYGLGNGVPEDASEAVKWLRLAAEQNDADAQYNLGVCYADGKGVPEDDVETVRWYRLAAD